MIKPTILLVLLMTIVGYIFCKRFHVTSFKFSKSSGYHTFLGSASFGGGLFLFSFFIFWLLSLWAEAELPYIPITALLSKIIHDVLPNMYIPVFYIHATQISMIALLLSLLLPKFLIWFPAWLSGKTQSLIKRYAFKEIASSDDSPEFTSITFKSWELGLPVAFTMSNRKVYIGIIAEGAYHVNDITLIPLKSGYRCKEEQRLELVTNYEPVFKELETKGGTSNDEFDMFHITLPIREIIHANLHDFKQRDLFQKHEIPKKTKGMRDKIQALKNPH